MEADYSKAGVPMLPVTHGRRYTQLQVLLYTLILFGVTLLPFAVRMSGWLYLISAIALGAGFVYWAVQLLIGRNARAAIETFRYSILYLGLLFGALLIDHYVDPFTHAAPAAPTLQMTRTQV